MPLIDLQRRLYEIGRIRLGEKGTRGAPKRLTKFRFTSTSDQAIDKVAAVYGGTRETWEDAPTEQRQFQVFTDVDELDVVIPPSSMAISQWYESWSGGGVQRRCDGNREIISDQPCLCQKEMDAGAQRKCDPHTRLNLMLPRAWGLGVWRLETSGWNAAAELAGAAELAQIASQRGQLSNARLRLETRTKKSQGQTRHFVVPVLDLDLPVEGLQSPSASFTPVDQTALPEWPTQSIEHQLKAVDEPRTDPPRKTRAAPIPETGVEVVTGPVAEKIGQAMMENNARGSDGTFEIVDSPPALIDDATVQSIAIAAREAGLDTDNQRHNFLEMFSNGAYSSTKQIPVADLAMLRAELVKRKHQRAAQPTMTITTTLDEMPAEEQSQLSVETTADTWTADRWLETLKNVQGIGQAKLLRKAREVASDLGQPLPQELGAIQDPHLCTQLLAWLKSHRDAQVEDPDTEPF